MSRKSKAYRAWSYQNPTCRSIQEAFTAGWDAQKGIAHARTIQLLVAENEHLQAERDSLQRRFDYLLDGASDDHK